jgi:radical SAM-linked protein
VKYVLCFAKTGNMVYISHLDLARLFLRALRMVGLRPDYSHGFNPHPKMSFALPLSLGFHSTCELLEFEHGGDAARTRRMAETAAAALNERLPEGIRVSGFLEKPARYPKSLAFYVEAASYEIMCEGIDQAAEKLSAFFQSPCVMVEKTSKKTGKSAETDIRGLMRGYRVIHNMKGRLLAEVTLQSAAGSLLNPQVFFGAFCRQFELDPERFAPVITRTGILGQDGKPLAGIRELGEFET